jgi:AcrR family transcriptional regulator
MARPIGRRGETRERILQDSLALFVEHGVAGTSLQMIANRLGVSKAAVYHQFPTKDEIILAVLEPVLDSLRALVEQAEAQASREQQVETTIRGLVDLVIDHRQLTAALQGDPGIQELLDAHPPMQSVTTRLAYLLTGPQPDAATLVAVAMMGGGLMRTGVNPLLADMDDDTLRREMLHSARRLLSPALTVSAEDPVG